MPVTFLNYLRNTPGAAPTDPWTNLDGRLNAPTGAAQRPTILNNYPLNAPPNQRIRWPGLIGGQPPWMVAGVDYAVGPRFTPTGNPNTITTTNTGTNIFRAGQIIHLNSGTTLSGFDMSSGWTVAFDGNGATVTDCLITSPAAAVGSGQTLNMPGASSNNTVQYCTVDGANVTDFLFNSNSTGTLTIMYTYALNSSSDMMNWSVGNNTLHQSLVMKYNLWDCASSQSGAHADIYQTQSGIRDNQTVLFNTYYINNPVQGTQGLGTSDGVTGSITTKFELGYNTFVAIGPPGGGSLSYGIGIDSVYMTGQPGPFSIHDNYLDPTTTGTGNAFCKNSGTFGTGFNLCSSKNNVRMTDGTQPVGTPWNN